MKEYKELNYREIDIDQVKQIMGKDFKFFPKVLANVFCGNCRTTAISDYSIYIDELGYIILKGACAKCGHRVARVMETAEVPASAKRAKKIYNQIKSGAIPEKIRAEVSKKTQKIMDELGAHYKENLSAMTSEEEKELLEFLAETKRVNEMLKNNQEKSLGPIDGRVASDKA